MSIFSKIGKLAKNVGKGIGKVAKVAVKVVAPLASTLVSAIPVVGPVASNLIDKLPIAKMAAASIASGGVNPQKIVETLAKNNLPTDETHVKATTEAIQAHVAVAKTVPLDVISSKVEEVGHVDTQKVKETLQKAGVTPTPEAINVTVTAVKSKVASMPTNNMNKVSEVPVKTTSMSFTDRAKLFFHNYWIPIAIIVPFGILIAIVKLSNRR